jgi:uncharacterized membrane protein
MVVLILATQRREYQLAQLREQLTLKLAILGEQKTAKVIQLLEESRRDNPLIRNRVDQVAEAMAQPADNRCSTRSKRRRSRSVAPPTTNAKSLANAASRGRNEIASDQAGIGA